MQKVRHYFPGGNTPEGFVSYYHEILNRDTVGKLAVIKGGPGTGKSTFMKRVGAVLEAEGERVDYLHCSSDNNSLDGVFLPKYNSAIIDGTAPHIVDARYPGAADIVLNFCDFINEEEIRDEITGIRETGTRISRAFQTGYCYLQSADSIRKLMHIRSAETLLQEEVNRFAANIVKRLSGYPANGNEKTMFLSAITPAGCKNYLDYDLADRFVVMIQANTGDAVGQVLEQVVQVCHSRNIDMDIFCCPMTPHQPEHLIFPTANLAITTANPYHTYQKPDEVVYFSDFCKGDYDNSAEIALYDSLLSSAVHEISKAKALHDRLEEAYIKNVDFSKISALEQRVLAFLRQPAES